MSSGSPSCTARKDQRTTFFWGTRRRPGSCGADDDPTLRRELWERRFGPSQLATDACQFKSNQTTLTELAAVALLIIRVGELDGLGGASGAAYPEPPEPLLAHVTGA